MNDIKNLNGTSATITNIKGVSRDNIIALQIPKKSKIVVGMSGGVDSAVVAKILVDQGFDVIGVFMRNWDSAVNNDILGNPTIENAICPEELDWKDVQRLGEQLGIEVTRVDFIKEYWDQVFTDLINEYEKGRTPNPDVLCNKYVKFGAFYKWVKKTYKDVDYIATGHYAKVVNGKLYKPHDTWKDQTYFLSQVDKDVLSHVLFPLSDIPKSMVRKIATKNNLIVANKKDSTGICFIGERDFTKFLQNYIPAQPGKILSVIDGKELGTHIGAMYYTIGQRKGLNMGGMTEPHYVAGHDVKNKIIYVAPASDKSYLQSIEAKIVSVNWLDENNFEHENLNVKFRYKSEAVECSIKWLDNDSILVTYPNGFEAVTPGQQAVFYFKDQCLGGGIIDEVYDKDGPKKYL